MKKVLSLLAGMVFVLAFGPAYADDMMQESKETGEKMIRDQDLQKYEQDQEKSTVTQMPSVPGEGGSAAGGTGEPGSAPTMTTPSDTGPAMKDPVQEMKDRY
jgi:hypothetical protein